MGGEIPFTVLIVEDNPTVMKMLSANFEKKGDRVIESGDGRDMMELIAANSPDILILDVMLPHKDGFTLLAELREAGVSIPVLMLTEKVQIDDKVKGLETGADDYITKPFHFRELYARIRSNLRRNPSFSSVVHVGSLHIDRSTRTATCKGKAIANLTKTEFDLLLYLAECAPRVVSHGDLLEKVLGYKVGSETKAMVMHIANLRRKMKENRLEGQVRLVSVPGVGYRLEMDSPA